MIARPIQARLLAFSTTDVGSPTSLSKDEAIAVLKSVLSFLNLGVPGKKLEEIGRGSSNVQTKWQSMMEVRLQTELHVVNAFGFESSQMGMMAYRQTMAHLMQRSSPEDLAEIQAVRLQLFLGATLSLLPQLLKPTLSRQRFSLSAMRRCTLAPHFYFCSPLFNLHLGSCYLQTFGRVLLPLFTSARWKNLDLHHETHIWSLARAH